MENSQALPPGTRLEEFLIERVLGAGGFGITYLARDTALGRQVVIKENLPVQFAWRDSHSLTVAPRHSHGEDAENFAWSLENFSKEAAMLASLDHPGIVRVHRSFRAFGTAYFVMPFVEGETLDVLTKQRGDKPFSEAELQGMLKHVLNALAYLHDRGIYHRDIKPGNILITNEGIPVLIDFGSARQKLSERSMTVVESPGYTPFEQLQSRGNVGPWSDLYALGATMGKIITGEALPKAADRILNDPWQGLNHDPWMWKYSSRLLSSIDRATEARSEARWQSGKEWIDFLQDVASEKTDCGLNPLGVHEIEFMTEDETVYVQPVTPEKRDSPEALLSPKSKWPDYMYHKSPVARIGVKDYWFSMLFVIIYGLIHGLSFYLLWKNMSFLFFLTSVVTTVLLVIMCLNFLKVTAKRFLDIGIHPVWFLLILPFAVIVFLIAASYQSLLTLVIIPLAAFVPGLIKGTKGENKYGPPPPA